MAVIVSAGAVMVEVDTEGGSVSVEVEVDVDVDVEVTRCTTVVDFITSFVTGSSGGEGEEGESVRCGGVGVDTGCST